MHWIPCLALLFPFAVQESAPESAPKGVLLHTDAAEAGYTLLAPLRSTETVLIDPTGAVVNRWTSEFTPGNAVDLLPNGHLLRVGKIGDNERFHGGGEGGLLEQFTWEGERVWTYNLSTGEHLHHHDFDVLPNGNVLVIVWEGKSQSEALAAGRRPNSVDESGFWPDAIWELKPVLPDSAEIVWAWHAWDHLVQDHDASLPNYGNPAEFPERIDVNIGAAQMEKPETEEERLAREEQLERLRALGYVGEEPDDDTGGDRRQRRGADWMHTNSVDYDAELNLIALSVRNFSEVFVIDHSTTTEQAAGSEGGRYGRGGEILWRWGKPANHHQGLARTLFGQHDARWLRDGEQVALSVFNNGDGRPEGNYSSVDLVHVPVDSTSWATDQDGRPVLSGRPAWSYTAPEKSSFFSSHISGAMPLKDGRFLVCDGDDGRVFQVNRAGDVLWDFHSPFRGEVERGGPSDRRRGPRGGEAALSGDGPRGRRPEGPPGGRPRGGPGRRGGPGSANSLFRAVHVPLDHPGVIDHLGRSIQDQ